MRLTRQVTEAIKILEDNNWNTSYKIKTKLSKLGFKWEISTGIAFIGTNQVLKKSYICYEPPNRAIDTKVIKRCNERFLWVVQPKCEMLTSKEFDRFMERNDLILFGKDIHIGNIGKYRKKYVAIDW
jgi:hypothetical protein